MTTFDLDALFVSLFYMYGVLCQVVLYTERCQVISVQNGTSQSIFVVEIFCWSILISKYSDMVSSDISSILTLVNSDLNEN